MNHTTFELLFAMLSMATLLGTLFIGVARLAYSSSGVAVASASGRMVRRVAI